MSWYKNILVHTGTNNVNTLRKRHVNEIQWSQLDEQHLKKKNHFNGLHEMI